MYLAILKCTTVDIAAHGHILIISDSLVVSMSRSFVDWVLCYVQWNPINTDTKGTCQSVRIIGVSVLSRI